MTPSDALVPLAPGAVPRRWQEEAMLAIRANLPKHTAILVSAATGTGKGTLLASMIVKAARAGKRTLFLVHRDELIDDVMARARAIEPALFAGKVKGKLNEIDRTAVFASVQSLHKKRLPALGAFDFVITDEAHHSTARSYRAIYARVAEQNPKWKHVGFTATPFRNVPGGKTGGLGKVFTEMVYEYNLQDAITEGCLCPVRARAVETELDLTDVDPEDEKKLAAMVDTEERNAIVADKYVEHASGRQGIIFAASIAHAQNIAAVLRDRGVNAEAVWGIDKERTRKIAGYQTGRIAVLCNNNLLSEGFDAPMTSVVGLARPTQSRGLYAQQVGRVTRLYPGKVDGLVLDFVDNSTSHELITMANLTTPDGSRPRIEIGSDVRHRRFAEWEQGSVDAVRGFVSTDEPGEAHVSWRGRALLGGTEEFPENWCRCDHLVLLARNGGSEEIVIAPSVIGVNEYTIHLFGDGSRRTGWYTYEGSKGKILVARGRGVHGDESAILRQAGDRQWEAWRRRGDDVELLTVGTFAEARASVRIEKQSYDKGWTREPATPGQIETLRKFNVRKPDLSKGEASLMIEMKIILLLIARDARGGRKQDPIPFGAVAK